MKNSPIKLYTEFAGKLLTLLIIYEVIVKNTFGLLFVDTVYFTGSCCWCMESVVVAVDDDDDNDDDVDAGFCGVHRIERVSYRGERYVVLD